MLDRKQLAEIFEAVDSQDSDRFVSFLTDDAVFRYGSQEPVRGVDAVRNYVAAFFDSLDTLSHEVTETWAGDGSLVCTGQATYRRHDGKDVTIPFTNIFRFEGEKIREYLVYADPAPLFAGE